VVTPEGGEDVQITEVQPKMNALVGHGDRSISWGDLTNVEREQVRQVGLRRIAQFLDSSTRSVSETRGTGAHTYDVSRIPTERILGEFATCLHVDVQTYTRMGQLLLDAYGWAKDVVTYFTEKGITVFHRVRRGKLESLSISPPENMESKTITYAAEVTVTDRPPLPENEAVVLAVPAQHDEEIVRKVHDTVLHVSLGEYGWTEMESLLLSIAFDLPTGNFRIDSRVVHELVSHIFRMGNMGVQDIEKVVERIDVYALTPNDDKPVEKPVAAIIQESMIDQSLEETVLEKVTAVIYYIFLVRVEMYQALAREGRLPDNTVLTDPAIIDCDAVNNILNRVAIKMQFSATSNLRAAIEKERPASLR